MENELLENLFKKAWEKAEESTCLKKKVGALLVNEEGRILGEGCGQAEAPCIECVRKKYEWTQDGCWSIHSEVRAIIDYFDKNFLFCQDSGGINTIFNCTSFTCKNSFHKPIMLVTHGPCDQCIKYMSYFKIPLVLYDVEYKTNYLKWAHLIKVHQKDTFMEMQK